MSDSFLKFKANPHKDQRSVPNIMSPRESIEGSAAGDTSNKPYAVRSEDDLVNALGISMAKANLLEDSKTVADVPTESEHVVVPDPHADEVDLSDLRGTRAPTTPVERTRIMQGEDGDDDLNALAEIVPAVKSQTSKDYNSHTMTIDAMSEVDRKVSAGVVEEKNYGADDSPIEVAASSVDKIHDGANTASVLPSASSSAVGSPTKTPKTPALLPNDSMQVQNGTRVNEKTAPEAARKDDENGSGVSSPLLNFDDDQNLGGFDDVHSDTALNSDEGIDDGNGYGTDAKDDPSEVARKPSEDRNPLSSNISLSTATQTHEVRMPMYLPTFKPATGCTNASDFIVRCFVARLRSGITVVKHGRSRWCKSRLRILHIHPDGRSLSWKPASGEPSSSKRPPKLDLSTCTEVRHAWSPDPLNPMFTGTPILRQKCEAANAHKSFALIFPKRTVDITAVTADQCKVLMEGFSALCFRLQVANLAGRGAKKGKDGVQRANDEEEVATTTASVTLTNNSTQLSPSTGGNNRQKRR